MKKVSGTIAMILVLVMLAGSFTGCLTYTRGLSLLTILDIIFLPISLLALLIYLIINDASDGVDVQTYLAGADDSTLMEYYSFSSKIRSLPEQEVSSLERILESIPEAERVSSMSKLTSLSETQQASLVNAYGAFSERQIVSLINKISSATEAELLSLLRAFVSLSEARIDSLIDELKSLQRPEYVAVTNYSAERAYMERIYHN